MQKFFNAASRVSENSKSGADGAGSLVAMMFLTIDMRLIGQWTWVWISSRAECEANGSGRGCLSSVVGLGGIEDLVSMIGVVGLG